MISFGENAYCEGDFIRINLVCGISTNDVHDGLFASRMMLEPSVKFEDFAVDDDDCIAICDQPLDLSSSQAAVFGRDRRGGAVRLRSHCGMRSDLRYV